MHCLIREGHHPTDYEQYAVKIILSLFEKMDKALLNLIRQEAERLAYFVSGEDYEIIVHE